MPFATARLLAVGRLPHSTSSLPTLFSRFQSSALSPSLSPSHHPSHSLLASSFNSRQSSRLAFPSLLRFSSTLSNPDESGEDQLNQESDSEPRTPNSNYTFTQEYLDDPQENIEFVLRTVKGAGKDLAPELEKLENEELMRRKRDLENYYERADMTPEVKAATRKDTRIQYEMNELFSESDPENSGGRAPDSDETDTLGDKEIDPNGGKPFMSRDEYYTALAEPWDKYDKFTHERLEGLENTYRRDGRDPEGDRVIGPTQYPTRHVKRTLAMVSGGLDLAQVNEDTPDELKEDEALIDYLQRNKNGLRRGLVDLINTMVPMTTNLPTHHAPPGEEEKLHVPARTLEEWVEGVARVFHAQMYGETQVYDKRAVMKVARALRYVFVEEGGEDIELLKQAETALAKRGRPPRTKADLDDNFFLENENDLSRYRKQLLPPELLLRADDPGFDAKNFVDPFESDAEVASESEFSEYTDEASSAFDELEEIPGENPEGWPDSDAEEIHHERERKRRKTLEEKNEIREHRQMLLDLLDLVAHPQGETELEKHQNKTRIPDLKYFHLYPRPVKQWVIDTKTPIGYYDEQGYWSPMKVTERLLRHSRQKMREAANRYLQRRLKLGIGEGAYPIFPADLKGQYRFGLKPEEVNAMGFEEKTHRILSFAYASQREINKFRVQKAIEKYGRFPGDTGSDESQMAVLTERVKSMSMHFRTHHKDYTRKRHMAKLLSRRKKVMNRLKYNNTKTYYEILWDLQIPDSGKAWNTTKTGGIRIPKKCRMSKQKRARLVKGKSISQKAFALAAAKKGKRK